MKPKKRKDDTGLYMRQWNMELRETISRNMTAYENKVRECKELRKINKDLKMLCSKLEREHETVFEEWKAVIEEYKELKQELQEANDSITWWQNRYNAVERDNRNLKNNRDKAIEYVESHFIFNDETGECYQTYTFDKDNVKELYDILKGDSDENK